MAVSTIHRAKGLEWAVVFVPYFNDGFMPMHFRAGTDDRRHVRECAAHQGGACSRNCTQLFIELDRRDGRGTAEERHHDEEHRLVHVAATRAKDALIFTAVERVFMFDRDERRMRWVDTPPSPCLARMIAAGPARVPDGNQHGAPSLVQAAVDADGCHGATMAVTISSHAGRAE